MKELLCTAGFSVIISSFRLSANMNVRVVSAFLL